MGKLPRQGPIYQCENGHCICSDCHAKVIEQSVPNQAKCPSCREDLGKIRNLAVEKVLGKMSHKCEFVDYGCTFEETPETLKLHEEDCQYRLVNCIDLSCKTKISMAQLISHVTKDHKEALLSPYENPLKFALTVTEEYFEWETTWQTRHITLQDKHFFGEIWRNSDGLWNLWVYMIGSKRDCKGYTYTIRIFSDDENKKVESTYTNYCVPLDRSKEQVVAQGKCLTITDAAVREFLANKRVNYDIIIKSVD